MFYTIEKEANSELIEKKSKFIAEIYHIENKEEAENIINEIKKKYYDAKHHCFAYITMNNDDSIIQKYSDDGEPQGTAGSPILTLLKSNELCNVLLVVTRYFGGILLGTGGLLRAYTDVAKLAIEKTEKILKQKGQLIKVETSYAELENVKYYCKKNNINIVKEEYSDKVTIFIELEDTIAEKMKLDIDNYILNVTKFDKITDKYI